MRIPKDKKYCSSLDEADQYLDVIKFVPCVHCGKVGFLNRHGFLKGYPPKGSDKLVRGCRIYCSNRNNRNGCGRTCSLLLSTLIIGFSISTGLLWAFMRKVSAGNSIKASWEGLNTGLPVENAYHWLILLLIPVPVSQRLICSRLNSMLYRVVFHKVATHPTINADQQK